MKQQQNNQQPWFKTRKKDIERGGTRENMGYSRRLMSYGDCATLI